MIGQLKKAIINAQAVDIFCVQYDEYKWWYHKVYTNLAPAAFKRFSKNSCIRLCQQCFSDAINLLSEAITMLNASKRIINKCNWDTSNGTRLVNAQINVKLPQISSWSIDLKRRKDRLQRCLLGIKAQQSKFLLFSNLQQETSRKLNRKARPASSKKTTTWLPKLLTFIQNSIVCVKRLLLLPQWKLMNGYKPRIRNNLMLLKKNQSSDSNWEVDDWS